MHGHKQGVLGVVGRMRPVPDVMLTCTACGKTFMRRACEAAKCARDGRAVFCSKPCVSGVLGARRARCACGSPVRANGTRCTKCASVTLTCDTCGDRFARTALQQDKHVRRGAAGTYCSRACLGATLIAGVCTHDGACGCKKQCTRCHESKLLVEFRARRDGSFGRDYRCRACRSTEPRPKHHGHPPSEKAREQIRKRSRESQRDMRATPDGRQRAADYATRARYGISYSDAVDRYGECCGVCGCSHPGSGRTRFSIDHDHVTGKVRGLLCTRCNSAIGILGDNSSGVQRAVSYLERDASAGLSAGLLF